MFLKKLFTVVALIGFTNQLAFSMDTRINCGRSSYENAPTAAGIPVLTGRTLLSEAINHFVQNIDGVFYSHENEKKYFLEDYGLPNKKVLMNSINLITYTENNEKIQESILCLLMERSAFSDFRHKISKIKEWYVEHFIRYNQLALRCSENLNLIVGILSKKLLSVSERLPMVLIQQICKKDVDGIINVRKSYEMKYYAARLELFAAVCHDIQGQIEKKIGNSYDKKKALEVLSEVKSKFSEPIFWTKTYWERTDQRDIFEITIQELIERLKIYNNLDVPINYYREYRDKQRDLVFSINYYFICFDALIKIKDYHSKIVSLCKEKKGKLDIVSDEVNVKYFKEKINKQNSLPGLLYSLQKYILNSGMYSYMKDSSSLKLLLQEFAFLKCISSKSLSFESQLKEYLDVDSIYDYFFDKNYFDQYTLKNYMINGMELKLDNVNRMLDCCILSDNVGNSPIIIGTYNGVKEIQLKQAGTK